MARLRSRTPSCHAATFARSIEKAGFRARNRFAISSGLKVRCRVQETLRHRCCSCRHHSCQRVHKYWVRPRNQSAASSSLQSVFQQNQARRRAARCAVRLSAAGVALKAASIASTAPRVCMASSIASNSAVSDSSSFGEDLERARKSSIERRTAFGRSCFVMTTGRPRSTISRARANSFFASVAVIEVGWTPPPRRLMKSDDGSEARAAFRERTDLFERFLGTAAFRVGIFNIITKIDILVIS